MLNIEPLTQGGQYQSNHYYNIAISAKRSKRHSDIYYFYTVVVCFDLGKKSRVIPIT